jgi:hypothetical protein
MRFLINLPLLLPDINQNYNVITIISTIRPVSNLINILPGILKTLHEARPTWKKFW